MLSSRIIMNPNSIFVSIICYEDIDVLKTVSDMRLKAYEPNNLRIVVILQTDKPDDYRELDAEVTIYPTAWATGCGKARAEAFKHYRDEAYIFQTDSHMRFEPYWDKLLIDELNKCPSDKPILSTLPPGYVIATEFKSPAEYTEIFINGFYRHIPLNSGKGAPKNYVQPDVPKQIPSFAGGVLFARGQIVKDYTPDPYMFFHGEEHASNMRLWTKGYDVFSPRFCFCYHAYRSMQLHASPVSILPLEFTDRLHERSVARVQVLTGCADPSSFPQEWLIKLDEYGLGNVRDIASWEAKFGISLKGQTC